MPQLTLIPQLGFTEAVKQACNRVVEFKGRSRRSEFWWTYLAVFIVSLFTSWIPFIGSLISFVLAILMIPLAFRRLHDTGRSGWWYGAGLILSVVSAVIFTTNLLSTGMYVDTEDLAEVLAWVFSPINIFLFLVNLAYTIVLIVFYCQDSHPEPNKYGESPKYVMVEDEPEQPAED